MELSKQTKLAKQTHTDAQTNGQTCIDCHKGIVHFPPLKYMAAKMRKKSSCCTKAVLL